MKFLSKVLNISAERYLKSAGDLFIYQGDYESALQMVEKTLELEPHEVRALVLQGDILYCLNRDHEALDALTLALTINPQSVEALISQAGVLDVLGKATEALSCCQEAFRQIRPYQSYLLPSLYEQNLLLLLRLKKPGQARHLLKQAEQQLPRVYYLDLMVNYGHVLDRLARERHQVRRRAKTLSLEVLHPDKAPPRPTPN